MNLSYIALFMDKNDDLLVYKGKGRHSQEETQMNEAKGNLKALLRNLRNKLKINNTDLVLLALSVASDKMIWMMHMFPEVQFLDVAANLNTQNRDILFSVVKEATG